jgi:hypothetical protein
MLPVWMESSTASLTEILAMIIAGISWVMWFFTAGPRA